MGWKKFYHIEPLIRTGRKIVKECDAVSFDLFDTLMIRRIHDPDLVKLPVARYIACLAQKKKLKISWQKVQKLRDTIEQRHRAETAKSFVDHEACYPRFMGELLQEIFKHSMNDSLLKQVTEYELAMENSMLVPRRQLVDWLFELAEKGKKILIVSDIYLPAEHLRVLINHAGFLDAVTAVVSSADTFLAKASGKAFSLLEKQYLLDKKHWLHIGDNPISDGLRPVEFGIRALVLQDASEMRRKAIVKRYFNYSKGLPLWRGRALQQLMQPHEGENTKRSDLYIEGHNFLAPLIGGFVQYIAEQCRKFDIGKIFFLSREGWIFKKYWEKCVPLLFPDSYLPEVEYLYVSRMALAGASCAYQGLTETNVDIAFLPAGNREFKDVCRIFGLDITLLEEHLKRYELLPETCLSPLYNEYNPENTERLKELLEDDLFQDEIKRQTRKASDAMMRYFEEVGFFKYKQVAIVDIGWLGTIQRFLYEAVRHREDSPRCFGYLFGATRGIPYPSSPDNFIEGVIYDKNRFNFAASSILYARDLFEEAFRAPHPTLNGYKLTKDGYELEFRRDDDATGKAEKEQDGFFAPLQQGIIDAAERYGAASALLGYSLHDYRPWFSYLMVSKMAFPRTSEILNIRHKHHLDDFHGVHVPDGVNFKQKKHLWDLSGPCLNLNPFLRLKFFLKHLRDRINE